MILSLVNEAVKKGARKTKACEVLGIPIKTVQRWEKDVIDKRQITLKIPKNKLTEEERKEVISTCCDKRFVDLSPKEIVPILAEEGKYIASESTMYRILREERMVGHRENTRTPRKIHQPDELKATGPNQVWSWDITYLKTTVKGMYFFLYAFMDVWSRKIVAWDIFAEQTSENAKKTIMSVDDEIDVTKVRLHSDNGSPMKGATFLATLHELGIVPSFSRPACSNDNPYSEALFKTIKYQLNYPKHFKSIEDAKKWMEGFVDWYNNKHRHSGIKYVTPNQRHIGIDKIILKNREETYRIAIEKNPERWIRKTSRNWNWDDNVILNPNKKTKKEAA